MFYSENKLDKEAIIRNLKISKDKLDEFERIYNEHILPITDGNADLFSINSRQMAEQKKEQDNGPLDGVSTHMLSRIVNELLHPENVLSFVAPEEVERLPKSLRPQLTGKLGCVDLNAPSYQILLTTYAKAMSSPKGSKERELGYHMFRQGLDILDLDDITYEIIGTNPNSMGYWLSKLQEANNKYGFFKIPETKVVKVPLPILQLTRIEYASLTKTTLAIVNEWAKEAFDLDPNKKYFIKTGTHSSKFDFRNAKVTDPKEVLEIGEYLLFIHHQALQMAAPLNHPVIYGVSTTNEWVVREYVEDVEDNPCIYKGMPLHTEYRLFVDFDTNEILGIAPYWEPNMMKSHFAKGAMNQNVHDYHDYVIYQQHEPVLMKRFEENKNLVSQRVKELLPDVDLHGQWSLDVMQNGNDFYLIDMALAYNSALKEFVPPGLINEAEENWIPDHWIGDSSTR